MAVGCKSGQIIFYKDGKQQQILKAHQYPVIGLSFSEDCRMLASVDCVSSTKVWNTNDFSLEMRLPVYSHQSNPIRFNHSTTLLAVAD